VCARYKRDQSSPHDARRAQASRARWLSHRGSLNRHNDHGDGHANELNARRGEKSGRHATGWDCSSILEQVWSFVLSHVRLAPLIRRGTRNLKNP